MTYKIRGVAIRQTSPGASPAHANPHKTPTGGEEVCLPAKEAAQQMGAHAFIVTCPRVYGMTAMDPGQVTGTHRMKHRPRSA